MAVSGAEVKRLPTLKGDQARASDPVRHVWLSASAGTGKTQVLTARVFRLLLRGVDPGAILCLTFTKAGAAEMASRISNTLARWVRMDRHDLFNDLRALGEDGTPEQQALARTLFARVLDAPGGGIRIQTIHSFCQTLLSAFPVEAGLVPGFRPLDAREEAVLAREALAELLEEEARNGGTRYADAVGELSLRMGEGQAEAFLAACAKAPEALERLPTGIQPYLRRALDLPSGDIDEEVATACADDRFDCAGLRRVLAANRIWGLKQATQHGDLIERWLAADAQARAAMLDALVGVFHTTKGEPRAYSKKLIEADPDYPEIAIRLGEVCADLISMRARAAYADLLARALDVGRAYAQGYARAKRRAGAVDFDDLIRRTLHLLAQPGMGEWIRFKLDQTTDHILIDEAQDTNWSQWTIVQAMADEFFAGEGAGGDRARTLFTVGDYKQAIFGFQGTDPWYFELAERHFERLADLRPDFEVDAPRLESMSLTHSFRSTRPVLEFVDAAIAALPQPGMGSFSESEPHASEVAGPGRVTLLPPVVEGGSDAEEEGWVDDATREVAKRVARSVRDMIDSGHMLESKGRPLRPEDVMILVKRRGELASLLVARLYAEGVPVAGVDRLRLNAPLAVQDLLAAVRFALQPDDDLSLASLLVSPLIGWSQDDLMATAERQRGSLWRYLRGTVTPDRLEPLYTLLRRADIATPYRFLEEILSGPLDGRRKLLRRLGEEARDPISELLNAALQFEALSTPSLQRFLDWFDRGEVEIVRDPSQPRDAVRVMTAHGAKGLQAPLVILADATVDPTQNRRDILGWRPEGGEGPRLPIFRPRAAERGGPLAEAMAETERKELEEHWRLFYVAATRAEEQLIVTGALGPKAKGVPPQMSWYQAASAAMRALGVAGEDSEALTFDGTSHHDPVPVREGQQTAPEPSALPGWLHRDPPQESRPPRPLAPSSLGEDRVADPPPSPAMRDAAERGRLLHALFERLPSLGADRRRDAALIWLEKSGGVADAETRAEIADAACAILADPAFADIFSGDALVEAPIVAVVDGDVISGTVDRLIVTDSKIRVVDFKTGRRAPATLDAIPEYHLRQMAAYVGALRAIFPGRVVEAALLYTAAPRLFVLPDALLVAAKRDFAPQQERLQLGG
ncbi:double-strand break repair helicase AddA [Stakelama pacifica]|uniref:DNA 3'-5' helicase n=1 Tax=Stakelama pacifica TaxID=517720 RepID=A0A4R6FF83_9SPHN|nr:double-strand break repair helicase AddA [Stakelama pacifica]TDN79949.1 DNA helicase/exodeoxyribonuclease V subunit A [Stakelama pacifica]